ncbi:hypothetical protein AVEN_134252-1 [Araneus ventricosus]|uniref:Uncharacterized protein n=1 Tax=Araneus ventricosus TaxID=182803 RepID=A0A4Y2M809_ARAVE|nr:hypothetical protein AVEN_134252-1 [Araneus ventricosus]
MCRGTSSSVGLSTYTGWVLECGGCFYALPVASAFLNPHHVSSLVGENPCCGYSSVDNLYMKIARMAEHGGGSIGSYCVGCPIQRFFLTAICRQTRLEPSTLLLVYAVPIPCVS